MVGWRGNGQSRDDIGSGAWGWLGRSFLVYSGGPRLGGEGSIQQAFWEKGTRQGSSSGQWRELEGGAKRLGVSALEAVLRRTQFFSVTKVI